VTSHVTLQPCNCGRYRYDYYNMTQWVIEQYYCVFRSVFEGGEGLLYLLKNSLTIENVSLHQGFLFEVFSQTTFTHFGLIIYAYSYLIMHGVKLNDSSGFTPSWAPLNVNYTSYSCHGWFSPNLSNTYRYYNNYFIFCNLQRKP